MVAQRDGSEVDEILGMMKGKKKGPLTSIYLILNNRVVLLVSLCAQNAPQRFRVEIGKQAMFTKTG